MDKILATEKVDLVVLDVNLPGEDGFSICLRLRNVNRLPVVMVTSRGEDMDRILGIELGADDYLVKPFIPRELLARIGAVLRRSAPEQEAEKATEKYCFEGFVLELLTRRLSRPSGARVILTSAEFETLLTLCQRPGRVFSRDQLSRRRPRTKRRHHREPPAAEDRKRPARPSPNSNSKISGICLLRKVTSQ